MEGAPAPVGAPGPFTARRPARTQAVEGPPTFGQGGGTASPRFDRSYAGRRLTAAR
jgi:hypothetical protein